MTWLDWWQGILLFEKANYIHEDSALEHNVDISSRERQKIIKQGSYNLANDEIPPLTDVDCSWAAKFLFNPRCFREAKGQDRLI